MHKKPSTWTTVGLLPKIIACAAMETYSRIARGQAGIAADSEVLQYRTVLNMTRAAARLDDDFVPSLQSNRDEVSENIRTIQMQVDSLTRLISDEALFSADNPDMIAGFLKPCCDEARSYRAMDLVKEDQKQAADTKGDISAAIQGFPLILAIAATSNAQRIAKVAAEDDKIKANVSQAFLDIIRPARMDFRNPDDIEDRNTVMGVILRTKAETTALGQVFSQVLDEWREMVERLETSSDNVAKDDESLPLPAQQSKTPSFSDFKKDVFGTAADLDPNLLKIYNRMKGVEEARAKLPPGDLDRITSNFRMRHGLRAGGGPKSGLMAG